MTIAAPAAAPAIAQRSRRLARARSRAVSSAVIDGHRRMGSGRIPRVSTRNTGLGTGLSAGGGGTSPRFLASANLLGRASLERPSARERLVDRDAEGELVGPVVALVAGVLLRRHVLRRAHCGPGHRHRRLQEGRGGMRSGGLGGGPWTRRHPRSGSRSLSGPSPPEHAAAGGLLRGHQSDRPGQPQVEDAHPSVAADHDVARLEVSVYQARGVDRCQAASSVGVHVQHPAPGRLLPQPLPSGPARDELHRDEQRVADGPYVEHADDIGMFHHRQRLGLPEQALPDRLAPLEQLGSEHLERDAPLELGVEGLVDDAHRSGRHASRHQIPTHPRSRDEIEIGDGSHGLAGTVDRGSRRRNRRIGADWGRSVPRRVVRVGRQTSTSRGIEAALAR